MNVGDLWTRIKQRTDLEKSGSSGFVGTSEGISLIQLGVAQLQNEVMNCYEYWVAKYATFNAVTNQLTYPFTSIGMADFYKLLGIGITTAVVSPQDTWTPLEDFHLADMNLQASGFLQFTSGFYNYTRFALIGQAFELRPVKSPMLLGVYYVPRPPQFRTLEDELPLWIMPSWEEYVVAFAAWLIAAKERTGVETHKEIFGMIREQIKNFVPNRNSFNPPTVVTTGYLYNRRNAPLAGAFGSGGYY